MYVCVTLTRVLIKETIRVTLLIPLLSLFTCSSGQSGGVQPVISGSFKQTPIKTNIEYLSLKANIISLNELWVPLVSRERIDLQ